MLLEKALNHLFTSRTRLVALKILIRTLPFIKESSSLKLFVSIFELRFQDVKWCCTGNNRGQLIFRETL